MVEHKRVNESKKGNDDQRRRSRQQDSQPLSEKSIVWDIEPLSLGETPFHPQINEHTENKCLFIRNMANIVL